jgi:hypothetical protein
MSLFSRGTRMRFVPNPMFQAQLIRSGMLDDDMAEIAEKIAEETRANAPENEGAFKDGVVAEGNRVNLTDWKSLFIEFGESVFISGIAAPMRTAIESLGMKLERRR